MTKKRMNIYLSRKAWDKLHEQENMSRYLEELILKDGNNNYNDILIKIKELISKGNKDEVNLEFKGSVMNLLNI